MKKFGIFLLVIIVGAISMAILRSILGRRTSDWKEDIICIGYIVWGIFIAQMLE